LPNTASEFDEHLPAGEPRFRISGTPDRRRYLSVGENAGFWAVEPDGTTLGFDRRGWGAATAEQMMLLNIATDYSICMAVSIAKVEFKAATVAPAHVICALTSMWGAAIAAIHVGPIAAMAISKVTSLLAGLLDPLDLLRAADESYADDPRNWNYGRGAGGSGSTDSNDCIGPCMEYVDDAPPDLDWYYHP